MIKRILQVCAGVALLMTTGCAHVVMTAPQSTMENQQVLRGANAAPVNVGTFARAESVSVSDDQSISIRGANSVESSVDGSFTQYLRASLVAELKAAGLYDEKSQIAVTGMLRRSELDAAIGTGSGLLEARFVVTRGGAAKYDKILAVDAKWESSFVGAVAIPAAANNYQGLYRKLVGKLLEDPEFKAAIANS
jgi:hypothetical protein